MQKLKRIDNQDILYLDSNDDWTKIDSNSIVHIANDSYWGFRSMERDAKMIIYNPLEVNNLIRITKDGKKFKTVHGLLFERDLLPTKDLESNLNMFIEKYHQLSDVAINNNVVIVDSNTSDLEKIEEVFSQVLQIPVMIIKK